MGHARSIHLGVDIADQISLQIKILDQRKRIVSAGLQSMSTEDLLRMVAAKLRSETPAEELTAHWIPQNRHGIEIRIHRAAPHRFECRFGAQHARRPVGFWIDASEQTEYWSAH